MHKDKRSTRTLLGASVLAAASLLTACHHENPLKTNKAFKSAAFLVTASYHATKALHIKSEPDLEGGVYSDCMEDKIKNINCNNFYKAMVAFASKGEYPAFKGITVADLTDEDTFLALRDAYEESVLLTRFGEQG